MSDRLKEYLAVTAMLALTGFFYILTPEDVAAGGSIFPKVLMMLLLGLTLLKLASDLLHPKAKVVTKEEDKEAKANRPRFWFILGSIVVYVLAVDRIGFYVSSFIFFFGLTVAVQYEKRTPRGLAVRLAVVTCFMVFLYVLFTKILLAQLPKGILF
jgi:putative tricarboxylic transport membrane protein